MPKTDATITLVSPTPVHQGDTITFQISPPDAGVISVYGSREGEGVLWASALIRGQVSTVVSSSQDWAASPGPLDGYATLSELIHGKVKVIAETSFEIAG